MAITPYSMQLIEEAHRDLACSRLLNAASLGYPDLLLNPGQLVRLIGGKFASLPVRDDSEKIIKWHGSNLERIYESRAFFDRMGYQLDVFDIKPLRDYELFLDLNAPLWPQYRKQYDLVIDPGTCEHCFMMGQAIINVADMCKEGGFIVQGFPLNAYNHGFYNVSPTLIPDFYEDNGFEIRRAYGVSGGSIFPLEYFKRTRSYPENAFMLLLVKRSAEQKLKIPTQRKYREMLA